MTTGVPKRIEFLESHSVSIKAVYNSGRGKLLNLSSSGAYVETSMYLLPQAQVRLRIILPDEKRWIETEAVVAWENRGPSRRGGLPPGYGFRFIKLPDDASATIQQILKAAEPYTEPEPSPVAPEAQRFDLLSEAQMEEEGEGPPYLLKENVVRARVPEEAVGIFVLSYTRTQDARVGRADDDLRAALVKYVGQYTYFYWEDIEQVDERFYRECELYHRLGGDHGQLDNTEHPGEPKGSGFSCPVCSPKVDTRGDAG